MKSQKRVREGAVLDVTVGRELLEEELVAICGGQAETSNPASLGLGNNVGWSTLTNLLNAQKAAAAKQQTIINSNKIGGFPDFGSLSNLTNDLVQKLF